ncbi:S26 family signal peptidase [Hyphococcus luteus]|uniref:S26 family signal peptidase n=1 Tax=Hyphococcus luteus TaxID=2058213 RepID=A0A2S7K9S1_9PROT|nr:S26 family signal peptidase [Marinicaulis flavus]PQA89242.1 S26 family signal peptidase [Marinicaulis flavus]
MRKKPTRAEILIVGAAAIAAMAFGALSKTAPRIVWNASRSAPTGLYSISKRLPGKGDFVLAAPPPALETLIEERGYLPPGTPLLKRVAGLGGDRICRDGARLVLNGVIVARARKSDSDGRPLPQWSGCITLGAGEIFLLNDHERSLDGRYFGAMKREIIIGVATPIWTKRRKSRFSE